MSRNMRVRAAEPALARSAPSNSPTNPRSRTFNPSACSSESSSIATEKIRTRPKPLKAGFVAVVRVRGVVDNSPRRCTSTFVLNPAQKGKGRLHEESALTTVAGARYAQRCPVEFGVPMEAVIAA